MPFRIQILYRLNNFRGHFLCSICVLMSRRKTHTHLTGIIKIYISLIAQRQTQCQSKCTRNDDHHRQSTDDCDALQSHTYTMKTQHIINRLAFGPLRKRCQKVSRLVARAMCTFKYRSLRILSLFAHICAQPYRQHCKRVRVRLWWGIARVHRQLQAVYWPCFPCVNMARTRALSLWRWLRVHHILNT